MYSMQMQHTMNCQYGAGEQCIRAVFAQDTFPYMLCSAPQAPSCTTETYPLRSAHVGQAGRETPNAVFLDEIAKHETTGQGEPSRAGHCAPGNGLSILEGKSSKKCYIDGKTTKEGFGHCKT